METVQKYLSDCKIALGDDFESMESTLIEYHYSGIEKHIKAGGKINQDIFDGLDDGKQFHFNKHYNRKNDKIIK